VPNSRTRMSGLVHMVALRQFPEWVSDTPVDMIEIKSNSPA
jgi:hypothetical protein